MKTLKDFEFNNKRVLVRCEFNVLDERGNVRDDFRIQKTLPTIKYLVEQKAKVILMCHVGEPEGKVVPELKTDKIAQRLSELLDLPVEKSNDCVGPETENDVASLKEGQILLLENLRFHKEETANDVEFAKQLAKLGEIYVNDAFGVCHRNNASVSALPKLLPNCAGLLLQIEIEMLGKIKNNPERPMLAIIGGGKVGTKTKFINNMSEISDTVIISGLMAKESKEKNMHFSHTEKIVVPVGDLAALDINKESIDIFTQRILKAKTILWNGPFGKFEDKKYAKGTLALAKAIVKSKAFSVVGGGETVEFLSKQGMIDKFSWVSTGGGAMLSYFEGTAMPGLESLG